MPERLRFPADEAEIRSLRVGDAVLLSGVILTARDTAHQWLFETFIQPRVEPGLAERQTLEALQPVLAGGAVFHCGPVVQGLPNGPFRFVSAGPTTSLRQEPYQAGVMRRFGLRAVIGKGGMGEATRQACQELKAVYLHAVGGAGSLIAACVTRVIAVHRLDFGVPEAMWVIEVRDLPAVVTIDAHGASLHERIWRQSRAALENILDQS